MTNKEENTKTVDWYLFDAKDEVLGRLASKIAFILRGKHKSSFAPHLDMGDYCVVINADKFILTGKKEEQKRYYKHTGYIGNLKEFKVKDLKEKQPGEVLRRAIYGMLPSNKLRDLQLKKLKIYSEDTHPHKEIKFKNQG